MIISEVDAKKIQAYDKDFKFLDKNALTITPKLSVFASSHYQDATVNGEIFSDEVEGAVTVDYNFSKDILFKELKSNDFISKFYKEPLLLDPINIDREIVFCKKILSNFY